jgi:signal transduction histidine kinase
VCTLALYERDADERPTAMQLCGVWSPDGGVRQIVERIPYSPDALDGPLDAGETVTIRDIHSDLRALPELRAIQQRDGRPALAFIPLLARGRRIGLVILSYPQPHNWPADTLRLYQTTAAQLASAIDSRQQHRLLAERSQQVAVLEERRRLARELHDSVTQSLFSMSLLSQVIPDLWQADRAEALDALSQIRDLTRGALTEMRELLYELRPADSGEQDLAQALRAHCGAFARRSGLNLRCDLASPLIMPAGPAQALLRIAQEALTNIDHHASARQVEVVLRAGPPARLRIADDGRGFTPEHVAAGRLGLILMRERAAAIGAALDIRSAPGQGTEVQISWGALMGAAEGGL